MEINDLLFSFVPLLMIVLFLFRFILKIRKKNVNRPKPLNTIPPFSRASLATPTDPPHDKSPQPESLNALAQNYTRMNKAAAYKPSGLNKVNSLPELKKAFIWSEIIGKPKGLD